MAALVYDDLRRRWVSAWVAWIRLARSLAFCKQGPGARRGELTVNDSLRSALGSVFGDAFSFPLGAVLKVLEKDKAQPTDDHTRTGLNAATWMGILAHKVTSYEDVAAFLKTGYVMHVSDVDAAFPQLPLSPWLWPFFFHRFYPVTSARPGV